MSANTDILQISYWILKHPIQYEVPGIYNIIDMVYSIMIP